jgi:hypothetical protein
MAKAYLSAKSPDLLTRTWADVMEHYSITGVESTRKRKATAFRSRPFAHLHGLSLMDTEAAHLLAVLEHERAGNSAHHYLRRLHNYALRSNRSKRSTGSIRSTRMDRTAHTLRTSRRSRILKLRGGVFCFCYTDLKL